ncbi:MAG: serine--tRNA ligase [Candidatus Woesearchaeota archaeon]|nr:MAG: serine--tRNA ligase [Candidatus Woesearchaeota archaeon]
MLAIELFRENPKLIKDSEKKRFKDPKVVDQVIEYDNRWRTVLKKVQELQHKRNIVSQEISDLKKKKKPAKSKILEMKKVSNEIANLNSKAVKLLKKRDEFRYRIGNILDKSVPVGRTDDKNKVIRKWGKISKKKVGHADLIKSLANIEKAADVAGARFYYLEGKGAVLNLALINYAFDYFVKKGFTPVWPPYVLKEKAMAGVAELADFKEQLYKLEGEDLYLIATAEQPLIVLHMNEVIGKVPKIYVGFSTNFRREAGAHGKDTKGIFRTHSFDKVEQIVICDPKDSWKWLEKMIKYAEELMKGLEIPYKVTTVASGEMNDNGAKKYDIEAWFPSQGKYRELISGTNCTDYQARKLNIKFGKVGGEKHYVHTLNCTGLATGRTISALIENHQQKDGSIKIPKKLQKYTGFKEIK